MMVLGIASAIPLAKIGLEIFAGAVFISGMLMLWMAGLAYVMRRFLRPKQIDR